jgi:hypothetical protein
MKKTLKLFVLALAVAMICLTLASCVAPNSDPDKAVQNLKDNNIAWAVKDEYGTPAALKILGVDGVDCAVSGTGEIDGKYAHITIIYFDEAKDAKEAYEKIEEYSEKYQKDTEDSDWVLKKSGKMIYFGTKDAVKAAK